MTLLEILKATKDAMPILKYTGEIASHISKKRQANSFIAIVCDGDFDRVFFRELVVAILDECTTRKLSPIIIDTTRSNIFESRLARLEDLGKDLSGILYLPAASSAESKNKMNAFVEKTTRPVIIIDKNNEESFRNMNHVKFSHYDNNKLSDLMRGILDSYVKDENVYWVGHENTTSQNAIIRYNSYSNKYHGEISCDPANARDDSYKKSLSYLLKTHDKDKYATFICLNDDIALGVDDAAFAYCNTSNGYQRNIKIWSFDCTKSLIKRRASRALKFLCGGTMQEVSGLARDSLDKIESISFNNSTCNNRLDPKEQILF